MEVVHYSQEEIERMKKCEEEIQQVLAKYMCGLHYVETKKNGVVVQTMFLAEPTRAIIKP